MNYIGLVGAFVMCACARRENSAWQESCQIELFIQGANWEGVGGDIQYLPDYQRSIIVDIRYVLFVIDNYAGADYLLNEMEISR